ncbi:putative Protein HGV2 [Hypsibius exemplaris]|uniref:Uncharacterized protein n=1 Tax=Hypsibius exemplaris TaxID=2072580 RepID=A0A1W0WTI2_HYPEX|nr:putative Protein HGV2 [Hypsibius exemplaris]
MAASEDAPLESGPSSSSSAAGAISNGTSMGQMKIDTPIISNGTGSSSDLASQAGSSAGASGSQAGSSGMSTSTNFERVASAKVSFEVARSKMKENPPDYETAIDLLDQVCVVLKEELGDLNVETCDALYYYGSALLESYQLGSDLMGNKATAPVRQYPTDAVVPDESMSNQPSTSSAPSDSSIPVLDAENIKPDDGAAESDSSNESDLESLPGGGPLDGTAEEDGDIGDETLEAVDSTQDDKLDESGVQRRSFGSSGKEKTEGDAIAELRYAWEIFEIARVGYEKRLREGASHTEKIRLSDIHSKLSLCAAENGDQNVAIVEALRSLKVCQEACPETDRDLAEAYFNLGSVYSMYSLLSEAADNMKKAVTILEARKVQIGVELLALLPETEGAPANVAQRKKLEKELTDLSDLIPDLMTRLQDTYEDMRLDSDQAKRLLDNWLKGVSDKCHTDAGVPVNAPPPINDISHLVRRMPPKRASGIDEGDDESAKRMKGSNGTAVDPPADGKSSPLTVSTDTNTTEDIQMNQVEGESVAEPIV